MHKGFLAIPIVFAILGALAITVVVSVLVRTAKLPTTNTNVHACTQEAMQCPDGSYVGRTGPNCEFTECPTTNGNVDISYGAYGGVDTFRSEELGIEFEYLTSTPYFLTATRRDDTVYVSAGGAKPEDGQFVQVMDMRADESLAQAIQRKFLSRIDPTKCFVKEQAIVGLQKTQSAAIISFPPPTDPNEPWFENSTCPEKYRETNGVSYFLADSDYPTQLLFFSIGQEALPGTNEQTPWQNTLRLIGDRFRWETYTNSEFHYTVRHPSTFTASKAQPDGSHLSFFMLPNATTSSSDNDEMHVEIKFLQDDPNVSALHNLYTWVAAGFPNGKPETYLDGIFTDQDTRIFDGRMFVSFTENNLGAPDRIVKSYYYFDSKNNQVIQLFNSRPRAKITDSTNDQILGTLHFTD